MEIHRCKELPMYENGIRGIDLFKIAGESISGWIPSWKLGGQKPTRQPFCSLMEERLLMYLEYHPQVGWYGRGDISPTFASTYNSTTPLPPLSRSTTCLTAMLTCTCQMPSASFNMAPCSLQRQGWSRKNAGNAIQPRQRQRAKWPVLRRGG